MKARWPTCSTCGESCTGQYGGKGICIRCGDMKPLKRPARVAQPKKHYGCRKCAAPTLKGGIEFTPEQRAKAVTRESADPWLAQMATRFR